jgi:glycosyltransferase involved in cell wall biosynthesis
MRIAFVTYGSLEQISGGFIYGRSLVGALRSAGHEVDVFGLRWHGYFHAVARNVVLGHPLRRPPTPETPIYDAVIQDELVHPSVFLTNRVHNEVNGGWPRGRSLLALVHNLRSRQPGEPLAALKARVERRYLGTIDGVIAVCAETLADVRALAGSGLPAIVIHPGRDHVEPGVDDRLLDERSRAPGPLRVLYAAAVRPSKGLARLLDALARVPRLAFTLDVVGSLAWPRYAREIRRQVTRLGFEAQVQLHGERTGAELSTLFRQSHVLALPSDREAYPLSCLEALGFGLPVLASSAGGTGEMFDHGREGFLLDPHDSEAWAATLRALAEDRGALRAMSGAALARYGAHATWREAADAAADFIERRTPLPDPLPASRGEGS